MTAKEDDSCLECEQWFALQVKCRHEKVISQNLRDKGYEAIAPRTIRRVNSTRGVEELDTGLFPGYIFGKFDPRFRLPILMTPGIRCVVGYGRTPAPLQAVEINAIRNVVNYCLPAEPCAYLVEGDWVRVVEGPLAGVSGVLLQSRSSCRVVISVSLIQQSIRVEVDRRTLITEAWRPAHRVRMAG